MKITAITFSCLFIYSPMVLAFHVFIWNIQKLAIHS